MAMVAAEQVSVHVTDELRALYRSFRSAGGVVSIEIDQPLEVAETVAAAFSPDQGGARVDRPDMGPIGPVRLMRSGLRPLVFDGAVAMHVSTQELAAERGYWHDLTVYVDAEGGVVAHVALEISNPGPVGANPWSAAAKLDGADAFEAFLAAYDPAMAFATPGSIADGAAEDLVALDRVAVAREDFVRLVAAFCGPKHPAALAAATRLNVSRRNPS